MAIQAIALLQLPAVQLPADSGARAQTLEDGVLLHLGSSFGEDPAQLSARVRTLLGEQAERHRDPRGVFFLPDVAAPRARSYAGVIEEVGEGGVWGPAPRVAQALPGGLNAGSMAALLGQMPPNFMEAVSEVTRQDPDALRRAGEQLQALLGQAGAGGIGQLLGSAGIQLPEEGLEQIVAGVQNELKEHPNRLANLAQELLGGAAARSAEKPDESDDEPKR